jgi:ATP-dependent Lon protease
VKARAVHLRDIARQLLDAVKSQNSPVIQKTQASVDAIAKSSPGNLADILAGNLDVSMEEKQEVLEARDLQVRLDLTTKLIQMQLEVINVSNKIFNQVEGKMNDTRKEFYLRQQLRAIKEELGEGGDGDNEAEDDAEQLEKRLEAAQLPHEARVIVDRELKRMKRMQESQPEFNVIRTYLEWMADLPWEQESDDRLDPAMAMQQVID